MKRSNKVTRKQLCLSAPNIKPMVAMWFVNIPACPNGFLMVSRGEENADEEPMHRVVIAEDFWLSETPVTQAQFDLLPGASQRGKDHKPAGHPHHPANNLNWHDGIEYCQWLTAMYGSKFPRGFRFASLPCEAQWEYACRGDATGQKPKTDYYTGDGVAALDTAGWYYDNSGGSTHAVGEKPPNAFGLYDMHGNVWEWSLDRWDASAYRRRWNGITDLESYQMAEEFGDRSEDQYRVLRGGSFGSAAAWCRSAYRDRGRAGNRYWYIGFRVCLVRSPTISQSDSGSLTRTASERLEGAEVAGSVGEADEILNTNFNEPLRD